MIPRKLVEAIFRRLPVLLLPIVLIPALVVLLKPQPADEYRSVASVWVSSPIGSQGDPFQPERQSFWLTDAQVQARILNELLRTESFRTDVATAAGLTDVAAPAYQQSRAAGEVGSLLSVWPSGSSLVVIEAKASTPEGAKKLADAFISQYQRRSDEETKRQTTIAVAYFNDQLVVAQQELQKRQTDVAKYLQQYPNAADPRSGDLNYRSLAAKMDAQDGVVSGLLNSIQQAYLTAASSAQGQQARFAVQDAPVLAAAPVGQTLKDRLGFPVAGLVMGLLISAAAVYLTFRTDHAIRSSEDLAGLGVPLLGYVPDLNASREYPRYRRIFRAIRRRPGDRNFARRLAAGIATTSERGS